MAYSPESTVLVVNDDTVSRHLLLQALSDAGFPSVAVHNCGQAVDWLAHNLAALVVLDLVTPSTNGYELLQTIRSQPESRDIPVVALAQLESDDDIARAFDAGADDFVRRTFRPGELVARIRGQLRLRGYIDELARKQNDARTVLELTQALASSLDLRDILFTVVKRMAEVTHVDRCSIVVVQEGSSVGYVAATSDNQKLHDLQIDLDKYPEIRQVMCSGEPLVIENTATDPLLEVVREDLCLHSIASLAIVPINYEDRTMGVLFLRAHHQIVFSDHELSVARTVSNATAIALRNARVIRRLRDRTERVTFARFKAEHRLRMLKRYESFLESTADGIMVVDNGGQILFANAMACTICGYPESELRGLTFDSLVLQAFRDTLTHIRQDFAWGSFPRSADIRLRRRDDVEIVLSINFSSVLRQDNAVLMSLRDVTRERMVEAELRKTKEFLERVIDSSANAILSVDRDGTVRLFNRASERCFGYQADQVIGKRALGELFAPEGTEDVLNIISPHTADPRRPRRVEDHHTRVLTASHELVPVSLSAAQIFDGGRSEGAVMIVTDLRDKLRMEARLAAAQEELQSRERQAIVAELAGAAAHELNQPLTSVMGYAELLRRKLEDGTSAHAAVEVIMSEAERMAEIVRKIGKITRYETKTYVGAARILDLDRASEDEQHRR